MPTNDVDGATAMERLLALFNDIAGTDPKIAAAVAERMSLRSLPCLASGGGFGYWASVSYIERNKKKTI